MQPLLLDVLITLLLNHLLGSLSLGRGSLISRRGWLLSLINSRFCTVKRLVVRERFLTIDVEFGEGVCHGVGCLTRRLPSELVETC